MKIIYSLFDGKIKGIAATIIQAVIDGSIDTHYVFTKEFYKEYENACSEDNDMNVDLIYDDILPDWEHSLLYINEISALKKDEEVFGVYYTKYFRYSGSTIACYVIANILNEFYATEKVYLEPLTYSTYADMPHILNIRKNLTGTTRNFTIKTANEERNICVGFMTFNILREPGKEYSRFGLLNTNLYTLHESYSDEVGDLEHPNRYRGFIPAFLNAILDDMIHRDMYRLNFFDTKEAELSQDDDFYSIIIAKEIPYLLYTPAQTIVDIYYPQSIVSLSRCLYVTDINFQDDKKYVVEKMLEIEQEQTVVFKESLVWNILNEKQQKMIQDYHQYFIQFLQKQLEILKNREPEPITDIDEEEPELKIQRRYITGFETLIVSPDKDAVLKELHRRIDGSKGKDIGIVLAAATYKYHVLSRTPSEKEFKKEFPKIQECSWRSISTWLKKPNKESELPMDIQAVILNF